MDTIECSNCHKQFKNGDTVYFVDMETYYNGELEPSIDPPDFYCKECWEKMKFHFEIHQ